MAPVAVIPRTAASSQTRKPPGNVTALGYTEDVPVAKPVASVVTVHVLAFAGRPGESTYGADAARGASALGLALGVAGGEGVAEPVGEAVGDCVGVDVLVTVAAGVRVNDIPEHDVAEMTKLSMRNVPVAPAVPVNVPRIRKAKPALPSAVALKATVLQQYHPAVVGVEIDAGVPSGAKVPAAPVVESSVAHTFGPVALW